MKKTRQAIMSMAVMTGLLGGLMLAANAEPSGAGDPPKKAHMREAGGHEEFMLHDLNLTSQQIEQLKKNKIEKQKGLIKLRAELETLKLDLATQGMENKPDMEKIEAITRQMGEVHGKMIAEHVKGIIFLRSILTDEQKKILDAKGLQFIGGMGLGPEMGMRGGPKHGWKDKDGDKK